MIKGYRSQTRGNTATVRRTVPNFEAIRFGSSSRPTTNRQEGCSCHNSVDWMRREYAAWQKMNDLRTLDVKPLNRTMSVFPDINQLLISL